MKTTSIEASVKNSIIDGFFLSYIIVFIIAGSRDFVIENYDDFIVESIALFTSLCGLWYYKKSHNSKISSYIALAIGSLTIIALTYINNFENYTAIFMVIFALAFFFMFEFKEAIILSIIYYSIEMVFIFFLANSTQNHPLLNNEDALFNLILATIFVMIFGFYYHFTIRKAYQALETSNREKELLIKEVHHRVKNNLNVIISMLSIQADFNKEAQEALLSSRDRVASIALVHDSLYKSDDLEFIDIRHYLESLIRNITQLYDPKDEVTIKLNIAELTMELNKALFLGLILNELLVNSFKHAFKNSSQAEINITFTKSKENYLFNYGDNGSGLKDNNILKDEQKIGSQFVNIALKQIDGKSKVYNNDGLQYTISFPT